MVRCDTVSRRHFATQATVASLAVLATPRIENRLTKHFPEKPPSPDGLTWWKWRDSTLDPGVMSAVL
jgi:hypothetical protein